MGPSRAGPGRRNPVTRGLIGETRVQIAVLGNPNSWYLADVDRAATARGHRCERLDFRNLVASVEPNGLAIRSADVHMDRFDAVVVRTMPPGSLEQVVYRMDALAQLERAGVCVLNSPRAIECAVDKFLTTARLQGVGLPTPRTIVCESAEAALEAFEALGGDVVVKPLFGAEGRGISRVSDPDIAFRVFRALERLQAVLYVQEFIPHPGFDVRILLLDGDVVGAVRRSNPDDFRTNLARQGQATSHAATDAEVALARAAADVVGGLFVGVDLLYDLQGRCLVIEVNAVPGWRGLARATGVDVAAQMIEFLERRTA